MRICFKVLLLLLLLTLPAVVQAQYYFTTNNGTITITEYVGSGGAVAIPDRINGLRVTSIGNSAFYSCSNLTSITIPNSVTDIGTNAFYNCSNLTSVTISTNLTSIRDFAFRGCSNLASITIPDSVTSFGRGAFDSCFSLTNASIGNGVTSIPADAFVGCISLTSVTIPDSVTNIGGGAFWFCTSLTGVYFNGNAPTLGPNVFEQDVNATVYYQPGTVGWGTTFGGLPAVIMEFGYTINGNAITITAYSGRAGGEVIIPNNINGVPVTSIGNSAFAYCTRLTTITIPNSVTNIGDNAFFGCTRLASITIPSSVTSIGDNTFQWCDSLTSITVPGSVTSIGGFAFFGCTTLSEVYFTGNAPSVGSYLFTYASPVVYYRPGTTGWGTTFAGCPTALWNPQVQTGDRSFGVRTNGFGFIITGTSNLVIVVEACTNLANPLWSPVGTNTLTGGSSFFSDSQWTNYPARLYRLRSL